MNNLDFRNARLSKAQLQGADLLRAQFDNATSLTAATLRGAAVKEVDFTSIPKILPHLDDIYGDASVTLPDGIKPGHDDWPSHWLKGNLDWSDFLTAWKTWQATLPPGWDKDIPKD